MTAEELRRHIVELLPPIFRAEVSGGEPLAATLTDEMVVTALADHLRRQDEGAELLADVAANLEKRAEKAKAENERLRAVVEHAVEALGGPPTPTPGVVLGTASLLRAALDRSGDMGPAPDHPLLAPGLSKGSEHENG